MKILETLRLDRMKWCHWVLLLLLILVTLTKMIPLWEVIYTYHVYPVIGTLSRPSRHLSLCRGRYFHSSQHRLGHPLSYSTRWDYGRNSPVGLSFLTAKSGGYPKKKAVFGRVIEYLLWVYVWFYAAWGLNYSQPVIYYRVGMQPAEVSEESSGNLPTSMPTASTF